MSWVPKLSYEGKYHKSKDKGSITAWSDTDSSDEYMDECGHFMAFAATTDMVIVESASDSEDSSRWDYKVSWDSCCGERLIRKEG